MTTYNTGNPVGSAAAKDLYDNAENLDVAINSQTAGEWTDRLGNARKTWKGVEDRAAIDIAASASAAAASASAAAASASAAAAGYRDETLAARNDAQAAASAIGPVKFYDTKAQADAAIGTMANGDIIEVAIDETRAGARTRYKAQGGALVFVVNLDQLRLDLATTTGATRVGWLRAAVGAVATTASEWLDRQDGSLFDFMTDAQIADSQLATPVLDHTAAIQAWLATLSSGRPIYLPAGKFNFSTPLNLPLVSRATIHGAGSRRSLLNYTGSSTNADLITYGDGTASLTGMLFSGFSVDSSTAMTGGHCLRIRRHQGGGNLKDVSFGETDANRKIWNGIWFDNVNVMHYDGFRIYANNDGVIVNGAAATDEGSDLWLDHGFILGGATPLHCGGGFGGLYLGQVLAYGGTNCGMLIDQARSNRSNREIVLSDECVLDGANSALLRIDNPGGILILDCNAFLSGGGYFTASPGYNIDVLSMPLGRLTIGSSHIKSAKSHGIRLGDNSTFVDISNKTLITDCGGWGIFSDASNSNVSNQARVMFNAAGQLHPNVQAFVQTGTGIGATSGSITSSSGILRYQLVGGVCKCYSELTISANGSGSGALIQTLPFPMKNNCIGHGVVTTTGKSVSVRGNASDGSNVSILNYDNSYPGADGAVIRTWLEYEILK